MGGTGYLTTLLATSMGCQSLIAKLNILWQELQLIFLLGRDRTPSVVYLCIMSMILYFCKWFESKPALNQGILKG
jgi:hypothetical protein